MSQESVVEPNAGAKLAMYRSLVSLASRTPAGLNPSPTPVDKLSDGEVLERTRRRLGEIGVMVDGSDAEMQMAVNEMSSWLDDPRAYRCEFMSSVAPVLTKVVLKSLSTGNVALAHRWIQIPLKYRSQWMHPTLQETMMVLEVLINARFLIISQTEFNNVLRLCNTLLTTIQSELNAVCSVAIESYASNANSVGFVPRNAVNRQFPTAAENRFDSNSPMLQNSATNNMQSRHSFNPHFAASQAGAVNQTPQIFNQPLTPVSNNSYQPATQPVRPPVTRPVRPPVTQPASITAVGAINNKTNSYRRTEGSNSSSAVAKGLRIQPVTPINRPDNRTAPQSTVTMQVEPPTIPVLSPELPKKFIYRLRQLIPDTQIQPLTTQSQVTLTFYFGKLVPKDRSMFVDTFMTTDLGRKHKWPPHLVRLSAQTSTINLSRIKGVKVNQKSPFDIPALINPFVRVGSNKITLMLHPAKPYCPTYIARITENVLYNRAEVKYIIQRANPLEAALAKAFLRKSFVKDGDIEALDVACPIDLCCPLIRTPITIPVRGERCQHATCFDLDNWLDMYNEQSKPIISLTCPLCNCDLTVDQVRIDMFVSDIIAQVPKGAPIVFINPDFSWSLTNKTVNPDTKAVIKVQEEKAFAKKKHQQIVEAIEISSEDEPQNLPDTESESDATVDTVDTVESAADDTSFDNDSDSDSDIRITTKRRQNNTGDELRLSKVSRF